MHSGSSRRRNIYTLESYEKLKELATTSLILMPSGDEVTVPQPQMPDVVREWNDKKGKVTRMKIVTSREFFEALEKEAETGDFEFEVRKGEKYSGEYFREPGWTVVTRR